MGKTINLKITTMLQSPYYDDGKVISEEFKRFCNYKDVLGYVLSIIRDHEADVEYYAIGDEVRKVMLGYDGETDGDRIEIVMKITEDS